MQKHHQPLQTSIMGPIHVPGLPASPTLTNPEMILPYEFDSTPSPTQNLNLRRPWQGSDLDFSLGPPLTREGPLTPTTPIIYGNGTMLSDIGEVTEAESTPGQRTRTEEVRIAIKNRDIALNSSPTMGYNAVLKRTRSGTHERKVSTESTSTVTSQGQIAEIFEDFDDSVSVEDSNFQGDDEESIFGDEQAHRPRSLVRKESSIGQSDDSNSSAALSRRAELILANAKKRLDTMEGNLTRARSSLFITPSSSMSSMNSTSPLSRSTPSPNQRIVTQLGVPPSKHRALQSASSSSHSRVSSENNISLMSPRTIFRSTSAAGNVKEDRAPPSKAATRYPVRSASAAAVLRDGTRGNSPKNAEVNSSHVGLNHNSSFTRSSPPHVNSLARLDEDDTVSNLTSPRTSIAESHFSTVSEHRTLTRSTSSMQMRDLRDQMKDLKGKISTLRDRAREENMRRRSMQSLRTPSPFTAAEQWYTQGAVYDGNSNSNHEQMPGAWNSGSIAVQPVVEEEFEGRPSFDSSTSIYEPTREFMTPDESPLAVQNVDRQIEVTSRQDAYDTANEDNPENEDMETEYGSDYGEEVVDYKELDGYPSESEESYYHETSETPVSHEDREDAFDYQNFFLHSAMGSLSRQEDRRDSIASYDSEDSVETARGIVPPSILPQDESAGRYSSIHERKTSGDSISTIATFATASEGLEDLEEDEEEETQDIEEPLQSGTSTPLTARRENFPEEVKTLSPIMPTFSPIISSARPNSASPLPSFPFKTSDRLNSSHSLPSSLRGHQISPENILSHNTKRPSISSLSNTSSGTARSFPLVKPKTSPLPGKENIPSPLQRDAEWGAYSRENNSPVNMLVKEDQILVERVVASLGKCVLGMQEVSRGSTEGRMWRRRLDGARRVLDGLASDGHGGEI